jgi:integrase
MATITQIGDKWRVQIRGPKVLRIMGRKSIAKTFDTKREAEAWGRKVEAGLDASKPIAEDLTVEKLIEHYRRMRIELGRPVSPVTNVHYMLEHLVEDLGQHLVAGLTPKVLSEWAAMRRKQGAGGYTVNMELSQLGTAIRHTGAYLQLTLPDVVGLARPLLHYGQLITGGGRRTRRPTEDELASLLAHLDAREPVVADAVRVAAITGLRRGEMVRIKWADVDEMRRAVLVRQRKHPRRIEARDEWVPLLGEAWDVVQRQPRGDRIFTVSAEKLTDTVTAAVRALGIPDLRLHDMRRQATSKLRELGFDADARKAVTGHRSDEVHSRYVAVSMSELHDRYAAAQGKPPRPPRQRKGRGRPP